MSRRYPLPPMAHAWLVGAAMTLLVSCGGEKKAAPPTHSPPAVPFAPSATTKTAPTTVESTSATAGPPTIDPKAWATCEQSSVELIDPPKGSIFNNAQTAKDAGFVDRTEGVLATMAKAAPRFTCCVHGAARHGELKSSTEFRLVASLTIDAAGKVTAAKLSKLPQPAPLLAACVEHVALSLKQPESPTKKITWVKYPLRFRLREDEAAPATEPPTTEPTDTTK